MRPTRVKAIQSSGRIAKHGTGMENPFLLAIALLESRGIAKPWLSNARDHKADSQMGVEKPINWRLLFDGSAQAAGRQDRLCCANGEHRPAPELKRVTGNLACKSVSSRIVCGRES
jgi:hypothetical protein